MIIRGEQLQALRAAGVQDFERRVSLHLQLYFPQKCVALGDDSVRASIRLGVARALSYGITSERDLVRFLNHMYFLGFDFDADPKYPWAGEVLRDPAVPPAAKMRRLTARTMGELTGRAAS